MNESRAEDPEPAGPNPAAPVVLDANEVPLGGVLVGRVAAGPYPEARRVLLSLVERIGDGSSSRERVLAEAEAGTDDRRFTIDVPVGSSVSYSGTVISVRHAVVARFDLARARDPRAEVPVLLAPAASPHLFPAPSTGSPVPGLAPPGRGQ